MNLSCLLLCAALAHSTETKVKLADLPPAVQKTIKEKSKGAKLKRIVKDTSKDAPTFEAELTVAGKSKDITIDERGNVIEIEENVDLKSLPLRAQGAIEKAAQGGKVIDVESISGGGPVQAYKATIKKAGKKSEIRIDPEGKPAAE